MRRGFVTKNPRLKIKSVDVIERSEVGCDRGGATGAGTANVSVSLRCTCHVSQEARSEFVLVCSPSPVLFNFLHKI